MKNIAWQHFPQVADYPSAFDWLTTLASLDYSEKTLEAYGSDFGVFLDFAVLRGFFDPISANHADILHFIGYLAQRPNYRVDKLRDGSPLCEVTKKRYQASLASFYDFLVSSEVRSDNPALRAGYSNGLARRRHPRQAPEKYPWVPDENEWIVLLDALKNAPIRTRLMAVLAYDGALRCCEVTGLDLGFFEMPDGLINLPADVVKGYKARTVHFDSVAGKLLRIYLAERKQISKRAGRLFLSTSLRNFGEGVGTSTWQKAVQKIRRESGLEKLNTHTFRHRSLTDLALAGWDINEIKDYAGHEDIRTTQIYIHLSKRDLKRKFSVTGSSVLKMRQQALQRMAVQ